MSAGGELVGYTIGHDGNRVPVFAKKVEPKPPLHILVIPETMCDACKERVREQLRAMGVQVP